MCRLEAHFSPFGPWKFGREPKKAKYASESLKVRKNLRNDLPTQARKKFILQSASWLHRILNQVLMWFGERGWCCDEGTRLPPMWPGSFPEPGFICGLSLLLVLVLAPSNFLWVLRFFLPRQNPTFPNSNSTWNPRATGLSVEDCLVSPSFKKSQFILFWHFFLSNVICVRYAGLQSRKFSEFWAHLTGVCVCQQKLYYFFRQKCLSWYSSSHSFQNLCPVKLTENKST